MVQFNLKNDSHVLGIKCVVNFNNKLYYLHISKKLLSQNGLEVKNEKSHYQDFIDKNIEAIVQGIEQQLHYDFNIPEYFIDFIKVNTPAYID